MTMSDIGFDDSSCDRLEGSRSMVGGLVLKGGNKKTSPKESILGLQKLAEEKRKRKQLERDENAKKAKVGERSSEQEADWEVVDSKDNARNGKARLSSGSKDSSFKSRHYRSGLIETPSHTGGVNEEIRDQQLRRLERDREARKGGVFAQSRAKGKEDADFRRDWDGYGEKRDKYSDGTRRTRYDREEQSERSSREPYKDKVRTYKEPKSSRSEWEETPHRSSRSRDERYTPRLKSKGKVQACGIVSTLLGRE